jgi:hypothetical protein
MDSSSGQYARGWREDQRRATANAVALPIQLRRPLCRLIFREMPQFILERFDLAFVDR